MGEPKELAGLGRSGWLADADETAAGVDPLGEKLDDLRLPPVMPAAPGAAVVAAIDDDFDVLREEIIEADEGDIEREAGEGFDQFIVIEAGGEMAGGLPGPEAAPRGEDRDFERGGVSLVSLVEGFQETEFADQLRDVVLKIGEGLDQREIATEADAIDGGADDAAAGVDPEVLGVERGIPAFLEGGLAFEAGGEEVRMEPKLVSFDAGGVGAFADLEGVEDALD